MWQHESEGFDIGGLSLLLLTVYLEICARSQGAIGRFVKNHKENSIKELGCNGAVGFVAS